MTQAYPKCLICRRRIQRGGRQTYVRVRVELGPYKLARKPTYPGKAQRRSTWRFESMDLQICRKCGKPYDEAAQIRENAKRVRGV